MWERSIWRYTPSASKYMLETGVGYVQEDSPGTGKKIIEAVFNNGELNLIEELLTPNFRVNGQLFGRDGFKNEVAWWRVRFPDLRITIEEMIAEGARVGVWYTACGTHMGEFNGIPPSGRKVSWSGYDQFHINNDRIADGRFLSDRLGIAHQLGAVLTEARILE